jgi:hypothetical protein
VKKKSNRFINKQNTLGGDLPRGSVTRWDSMSGIVSSRLPVCCQLKGVADDGAFGGRLGDLNATRRTAVAVKHHPKTVFKKAACLALIHIRSPAVADDRDRKVRTKSSGNVVLLVVCAD